MAKEDVKKSKYSAEQITVLEGLEPVRRRPGMYIGTTGPDGLHHLIWEIFDNSRDEAMGGFADEIEVVLLPGNRVRVVDNGRGVPVDIHKQTKVSALETIMTTLHAGGKFGGEGYKVSGGLHGVGASVVNALSIYCQVVVHKDGGVYMQEYKQGKKKAAVKKIAKTNLHGTIVTFEPDAEIFKEGIAFDWNKVITHLRQQAYLVKGLRITVIDAREYKGKLDFLEEIFYMKDLKLEVPSVSFFFEGGLLSLVKFYNQTLKPIHKNVFYVEKKTNESLGESVEIALQYVDDISARLLPFANNIYNSEGGTHVTGFKTALTRSLNNYGRKSGLIKDGEDNFTGEDVLEGLTAVISVKIREIQFEGQTKAKLGTVEAQSAVSNVFGDSFGAFLEENPDDARAIVNKVVLALKARKAAKAAKDSVLRKGVLEGMTLPGKLADCQSRDPAESELFVVEGDSAGGCFSAETKVALIDGRNISFKELVEEYKQGKENYCYTIGKNGNVEIAKIENPRLTKKQVEVIKIILDNNEEIVCTPDHKFMLRNGSYKEAKNLKAEDSLMPLYRQISKLNKAVTIKGYELVYDLTARRWIFTHLLGDKYNQNNTGYAKKHGEVIHHKDFNKLNNNPDNLIRMDKMEHLILHTKNLDKTIHSETTKQKCREIHKSPEFREKIKTVMLTPEMGRLLSKRAKKQWQSDEYKKYMAEKFLNFYNSNEEYRKKNNTLLMDNQKKYWADSKNRKIQADKVRKYFENNNEARKFLRDFAKQEWADPKLLEWRSKKTKEQWTPDFRQKRRSAYNQTYLNKCLKSLRGIYDSIGLVDFAEYNNIIKFTNDKSLIKPETVAKRFFGGDVEKLKEAVVNYNHKIKKILPISEKMDVYDLEVKNTHNFALASGVFVHNSAKTGRDRRTQAILPLRGKILNIERARLDKMLASEQIKNLVVALGTAIGDTFDISKLRYHKIIIATDADVDGAHIRTLLLTLLYRFFRPLIDGGFIYIAQPPLYKIKRGKEIMYAYSDEEKNKKIGKNVKIEEIEEVEEPAAAESAEAAAGDETPAKKEAKVSIQRYKGLGEMNAEELWETTMDPAVRILKQVTIDDAQEADKVFDILMGTDVPSRKSFIQSNAKNANIDL